MINKFLKQEKIERASKPWYIRIPLNIKDLVTRVFYKVWFLPNQIMEMYEKLFFGYTDKDVYNLNSFIIKTIYSPLKQFIKNHEEHGMYLPEEFKEDPAAWLLILKQIEVAFDSIYADTFCDENETTKHMGIDELTAHNKMVDKGLLLFGKHLRELKDLLD